MYIIYIYVLIVLITNHQKAKDFPRLSAAHIPVIPKFHIESQIQDKLLSRWTSVFPWIKWHRFGSKSANPLVGIKSVGFLFDYRPFMANLPLRNLNVKTVGLFLTFQPLIWPSAHIVLRQMLDLCLTRLPSGPPHRRHRALSFVGFLGTGEVVGDWKLGTIQTDSRRNFASSATGSGYVRSNKSDFHFHLSVCRFRCEKRTNMRGLRVPQYAHGAPRYVHNTDRRPALKGSKGSNQMNYQKNAVQHVQAKHHQAHTVSSLHPCIISDVFCAFIVHPCFVQTQTYIYIYIYEIYYIYIYDLHVIRTHIMPLSTEQECSWNNFTVDTSPSWKQRPPIQRCPSSANSSALLMASFTPTNRCLK